MKRHHSVEKERGGGDQEVPDPQHKGLLPRLRPYQKEAVRWMISRERERLQLATGNAGLVTCGHNYVGYTYRACSDTG